MDEHDQQLRVAVHGTGKNILIAYLLWFFLGYFGVHRFYLGRVVSGLVMLSLTVLGYLLSVVVVGFAFLFIVGAWWLLDAYLTWKYVTEENERLGLDGSSFTFGMQSSQEDQMSKYEQLEKLHKLKEKGIITEAEFEAKKRSLMD